MGGWWWVDLRGGWISLLFRYKNNVTHISDQIFILNTVLMSTHNKFVCIL